MNDDKPELEVLPEIEIELKFKIQVNPDHFVGMSGIDTIEDFTPELAAQATKQQIDDLEMDLGELLQSAVDDDIDVTIEGTDKVYTCPVCRGEPDEFEDCEECEGNGEYQSEDGGELVDCDTCNGTGKVSCDHCEGMGEITP